MSTTAKPAAAAPEDPSPWRRCARARPGGAKIAVVTAYDVTFARLADAAGIDIMLVGDSLGMVVQGQRHHAGR